MSVQSKKGGRSHHVVPNHDKGWDLRRGGAKRSSGNFPTQKQAVERGREVSRNQGTELHIHGRDGKIREKGSHGNDPYPPKV